MKVTNKKSKPSQRKYCEGNKKLNFHIKKLRERNFYSVFTMNVRFLFTFTVFLCKISCKKCWSHLSHGNSLVLREPDPIYIYIYREREREKKKSSCENDIYLKEYENESQSLIRSIKAALTGPP